MRKLLFVAEGKNVGYEVKGGKSKLGYESRYEYGRCDLVIVPGLPTPVS